jgi:flagellar basal body-associated protein FliL
MTELNEAAGRKAGRRTRFVSWKIIALLLVAVAALAGGAGYWYWMVRQPATLANERSVEPPFYLDLKPFVVSVADGAGGTNFVELGVTLALSGKDAGDAVTSISPELQDAMRQTVLTFKVDDVVAPAGVERLRLALIAAVNRLLLRRFGAAQAKRLAAGNPNRAVVRNVFFQTLIVE